MKVYPLCSAFALYFLIPPAGLAQTRENDMNRAMQMVDTEQKIFRDYITTAAINKNSKYFLQKFAINDVNNLRSNLPFLVTASNEKRLKGVRSLSYFMKEFQEQLQGKKINQLDIPEILKDYKQTLSNLLSRANSDVLERGFKNLSWGTCQLLANSFWEFDEKKQMVDISAYKRVIETPEYIFSFLETQHGFFYHDSLLLFVAKNYPGQLLTYLAKRNNEVTNSIRDQKNIYIRQLVSFSSNSLASELAPFTEQIVNNELTVEDILEKRKKVDDYYELLVNTEMDDENKEELGDDPEFKTALFDALSEKSLDFYVKKINDQHSLPDAVRFQPVQSLRPQDLYYMIVSSDEEMYTSTYLGLYKRLLGLFKDQSADSILNLVHMNRFRRFMRIAATYNTLTDFLHRMGPERSSELIHLFIADIEGKDDDEAIANASDIADAFITLSKDSVFNVLVKRELENNLKKSKENNSLQSAKLYGILLQVYDIVNNNQQGDFFANYKGISFSEFNDKGTISELVLFYGDEDGKNSYSSFMNLFKNKTQWQVTLNNSWVTISSLQGQPLKIYANLPLNSDDEEDVAAQDSLVNYLDKQSIHPTILVHRGHSYHLANTLRYLNPSVKLAILGSCGGYKNMKKIIGINPDVHIVASKQVGSMIVNDPLLNHLNIDLIQGKNIDWVIFWEELNEIFKNDVNASKLFEEYIPPYKNLSSYVIKLYKYMKDETDQ